MTAYPLHALADDDDYTAPRFRLVPFDALTPSTKPNYLVKRLIPRVGLVVVWGPPKCGKSFWMYSVAMHVSIGWEYRGRRVQQGPVVYCAFEGAEGFKARAAAFRQRFLVDRSEPVPFYLLAAQVDLVKDHPELIRSIGSYLPNGTPVAVVLDTLNRSLNGSESADEDMAGYIRAADAIREAFDCAVIIVHHCGIDATRPRGHTSLAGAVDAQLAVKRDAADNVIVTVEFQKDGPEGESVTSRLERVELGRDEDGDPITSCVIVPAEAVASTRKVKVTGAARVALDLLEKAIADAGEPAPASNHIPPASRTTTLSLWRRYCYEGTVSESDSPDTKQKAFVRASKRLQELGAIGVWGEHVWVTGHAGH
jgi:hypothetical protein